MARQPGSSSEVVLPCTSPEHLRRASTFTLFRHANIVAASCSIENLACSWTPAATMAYSLASRTKARDITVAQGRPRLPFAACKWPFDAHHPSWSLSDVRQGDVSGRPMGSRGTLVLFLIADPLRAPCTHTAPRLAIVGRLAASRCV